MRLCDVPVYARVGEVSVVLERLDVDLGERREFFAGEFTFGLLVELCSEAENMSSNVQA